MPAADVRGTLQALLLNPALLTSLSKRDLDAALRFARRARLLGRIASKLKSADLMHALPQVAVDQLEAALVMAHARERLARWEMDRIEYAVRHMPEVPLIVLKGSAYLLKSLPNTAGRSFADVDLLTSEACLEVLERTLIDHGWRSKSLSAYDDHYYRQWTHEIPPLSHPEREVEIDIHFNIVPRIARLRPSSSALIAASVAVPGSRYRVLCDEDMVLHAMVHLMFDSDLADKLRDLVDVQDMLCHFAALDKKFWERLVERAELLDLTRPAFYSLRYCQRLLGTPVPETALAAMAPYGPPGVILRLMDRLVPDALFPQHPDAPTRMADVGRKLLFVRSHWLRMPPWLLVYHSIHRVGTTFFGRSARGQKTAESK
jgi:Uncharacterised nucleotidyltransferase